MIFNTHGLLGEEVFCDQYISSVQYHNKRPDLYDTIKIKLPNTLHNKYHLVFSFYHIVCKGKGKKTSPEFLIGYSLFPFYIFNSFAKNIAYTLPVISYTSNTGFPSNYFSTETEQNFQYVDNGKEIFKFSTHLVSSLVSLDNNIHAFFTTPLEELKNQCNVDFFFSYFFFFFYSLFFFFERKLNKQIQ